MCRVPQNIRNYFTNYTHHLTPSPVPINNRQLGDALRKARDQSVTSHNEDSRETTSPSRAQVRKITEGNSHNESKTVIRNDNLRDHDESIEKKSGRMKELPTTKIESVPFT